MQTISAGPEGVLDAGQVVELPEHMARSLIETRHAEASPDAKVTARWPHAVDPEPAPATKRPK